MTCRTGEIKVDEGQTLRDYITEYMTRARNDQIHRFSEAIGVDETMLRAFMHLKLTEANINEFGRFDKLKATIDKTAAKAYLEKMEGKAIKSYQINMKVDQILRKFILEGGLRDDDGSPTSFREGAGHKPVVRPSGRTQSAPSYGRSGSPSG